MYGALPVSLGHAHKCITDGLAHASINPLKMFSLESQIESYIALGFRFSGQQMFGSEAATAQLPPSDVFSWQ